MVFFPQHSVADRLAVILDGLCRAVAAQVFAGGLAEAVIVLIWGRVRRAERRLLGMLARFRAGRVLGAGLPRRFGWLLPLVPTEAAGYGSQLRAVLAEAEVQALLAACPQARRVLAPVY